MNKNHEKIFELANDLKGNYDAAGIKIEFENEFTTKADNLLLRKIAKETGLNLTIKIGGCGCVNDIISIRKLAPKAIIAPMIESKYALEKFYTTASELIDCDFYFNLETITGFQNFDEILSSEFINNFKGIVFGRSDFCASIRQKDPEKIYEYLDVIIEKIKNTNLEMIVGGNISQNSIDFLNAIKSKNFKKFETRKIVFNKAALKKEPQEGLNLALEFEILFLKSKEIMTKFDKQRMDELTKRVCLAG